MTSYVISSLGPEKSQFLWESIKSKLASLNLYTDDVLSEYIMVLLQGQTPQNKIYEELVIFMNGPEVAEHFVGWLMGEVGRLEALTQEVIPQEATPATLSTNEQLFDDVQMGSSSSSNGARVQGTRSFSKALEGAITSTTSTRKSSSFSEESSQKSASRSTSHVLPRTTRNSPTRNATSRRVVVNNNSQIDDGRVQKVRLNVDFDRDEGTGPRRLNHKKISSRREASGEDAASKDSTVIRVKCQYWPTCRAGDSCPNVHPSETCKNFPNCQYGDACTFVHPSIPCKFQEMCQNPQCNYQHRALIASVSATPGSSTSTIQCRFYPRCVNANCHYMHPVKVQCRYGVDCARPECPFEHPEGRKGAHLKSVVYAPCKYGKQCARADCPYQHIDNSASASSEPAVFDVNSMSTATTTATATTNIDPNMVPDQPMQ